MAVRLGTKRAAGLGGEGGSPQHQAALGAKHRRLLVLHVVVPVQSAIGSIASTLCCMEPPTELAPQHQSLLRCRTDPAQGTRQQWGWCRWDHLHVGGGRNGGGVDVGWGVVTPPLTPAQLKRCRQAPAKATGPLPQPPALDTARLDAERPRACRMQRCWPAAPLKLCCTAYSQGTLSPWPGR